MRGLYGEFLRLFTKVSLIGCVISIIGLISGDSLEYMLTFSIKMILLSMTGFVLLFMAIIRWKFGKLFTLYQSRAKVRELLGEKEISRYSKEILHFPNALLRGFIIFGMLFAVFYLCTEAWVNSQYLHYREWDWTWIVKNLTFKTALIWLLALMLYNGSRKILKPVISWLMESKPIGIGVTMSVRGRIVGVVLSLVFMMGMQYTYLLLQLPEFDKMLLYFVGYFVVFIGLAYLFSRTAAEDVIKSIDQVRASLAEFNRHDFPQSIRRLTVESADEVGDLKIQFNELQEKAEKYYQALAQEMELAYRVQRSLLPSAPLVHGKVKVEGHSVSAADLGGDFYDMAVVNERELVLLIGDVSGKGLPASLVTATVLGLFRAEIQYGGTPSDLLNRMNLSISRVLMSDMYVTAAVLRIDTQHGHYQYASAGHLPPLQISGGELVEWETATFPLGFGPSDPVPEISGVLSPGDCLVFYTDGILETRSATGEIVGFENVREWVREAYDSPYGVLNGVKQRLERYRNNQNRQDDETLVVLHFGI